MTSNKHTSGKLRMDLIRPEVMVALASVLQYGAEKYGDSDYLRGSPRDFSSAMMRHYTSLMMGEIIDPESGMPHSWHVLTNAAILVSLEGLDVKEMPYKMALSMLASGHQQGDDR